MLLLPAQPNEDNEASADKATQGRLTQPRFESNDNIHLEKRLFARLLSQNC